MKIISSLTESVEKRIGLTVSHNGKKFKVYVNTRDGIVQGDAVHGLSTSYLVYFDVKLSVREQHFKKIKKYVESVYNI